MEYVVGLVNVMVVVLSKFGFVGSSTVPLAIVALPALLSEADVAIAPAAAIFDGSVSATLKVAAACAVGWTRNLSPAAGVPDRTIDRPAALSGLAAVPAPVRATLAPVVASVKL